MGLLIPSHLLAKQNERYDVHFVSTGGTVGYAGACPTFPLPTTKRVLATNRKRGLM